MKCEKQPADEAKHIPQVSKIVDSIHFQKSSIVSKTLIDKQAGTITLFAFDEGQGLSEHTAPFDACVYLLQGEAEVTISGNAYHVMEGDMIVMPANQPHALKAVKRFKMMLIMIQA
jgi:quercetin dioxygenase-like cupin family protein